MLDLTIDMRSPLFHPAARNLIKAHWRKSSYSGGNGGACVEVASNLPDVIAVRDSKNPTGPALIFNRSTWKEFLDAVKNGTAI